MALVDPDDRRLGRGTCRYSGPVYDLEVDATHTYVADGVLVHNSIYRFRGADIRNILEFEEAFPDVTVIVLEQNYRSTQTILDAANAVIANNLGRKPKELWTDQGDGERDRPLPRRRRGRRGAVGRARRSPTCTTSGDHRWGDVAVFYRTNAQSRVVEEALMRVGIPYKVVGGTRFYDRREVKDALAYLRAVVNPADEVSVKRVLNVPKRGVGDTHGRPARRVGRRATASRSSRRCAGPTRPASAVAAVQGHRRVPRAARRARPTRVADGPGAAARGARSSARGYLAELEAEHTVEAEGRLENLAELVGVGREFDVGRRVPRAGPPGGRHRRARRRRRRRSC